MIFTVVLSEYSTNFTVVTAKKKKNLSKKNEIYEIYAHTVGYSFSPATKEFIPGRISKLNCNLNIIYLRAV